MTTRTKLNITIYITSIIGFLNVFSKPLHIPEEIRWLLLIGIFVPIGFAFYLIKVQKREKAGASGTGKVVGNIATALPDKEFQARKQRLLFLTYFYFLCMVISPFAGRFLWPDEVLWRTRNPTGRMVYYVGTVVVFAGLGLYSLWFYRRFVKTHSPKGRDTRDTQRK